jgi:hypothetical protein
MTAQQIKNFVTIQNFMHQFCNNNAQKVIDSFANFIGKKIYLTNGTFVAKYQKPLIDIFVSDELKELGIYKIDFTINQDKYSSYSFIYFSFSLYGLENVFPAFNNPFGNHCIKDIVVKLNINEGILTNIENYKPLPILQANKVIQNFNTALIKKAEYSEALNKVENQLREFITKR